MVIVDSNVWMHFLRSPGTPVGQQMRRLLNADEVAVVGVVIAEVLQGARSEREFTDLLSRLEPQAYVEEGKQTWVRVGELSMQLRAQGRLVPLTDLVIAAQALEHRLPVWTLDQHFSRIPGVELYQG